RVTMRINPSFFAFSSASAGVNFIHALGHSTSIGSFSTTCVPPTIDHVARCPTQAVSRHIESTAISRSFMMGASPLREVAQFLFDIGAIWSLRGQLEILL